MASKNRFKYKYKCVGESVSTMEALLIKYVIPTTPVVFVKEFYSPFKRGFA
jgi:hypothetical protein